MVVGNDVTSLLCLVHLGRAGGVRCWPGSLAAFAARSRLCGGGGGHRLWGLTGRLSWLSQRGVPRFAEPFGVQRP